MLTVCIQIAIGFAMAKSGIVTPTVSRALSLIVFRALIPALLFSAVGRAIDVETFKDLLLSPVMAVVLVAVGAAIAGLLLVVLRVPQRERGIVVAMGSFGNSLFLPLALFSSLAKVAVCLCMCACVCVCVCVMCEWSGLRARACAFDSLVVVARRGSGQPEWI